MPSRDILARTFGDICLAAGGAILAMRARGASASAKADGSPVTAADLAADRIIRERLKAACPDIPVVTEEAADSHARPQGSRFILVDPLDGTREFVEGRDEFTVNIALIEDGMPKVGAIYAPALRALYLGGESAFASTLGPEDALPDTMQTIVAADVPRTGLRAVASRSHRDAETQAWLDAHPVAEICAAGSSLKFCLIAEGRADVYPRMGPTMAWDIAAGHAILAAAGGNVNGLDGRPMRYGQTSGYRNPSFVAWGQRSGVRL